uniref:PTB domain-containing protein n=1 Tax=Pseudonaja textilis TaxID=8673 RepID=A0A670Z696_PSETE
MKMIQIIHFLYTALWNYSSPTFVQFSPEKKKRSIDNYLMLLSPRMRRGCTTAPSRYHLVTFTIGEEDDLTSVEDAIRKLSLMDKQGKIWVQEMLLQVNGSAIKLLDINSKEELENYALATVAYCEAVCPESRSQSLLLLMCQETTQLRPDIHFFQCDQIRAEWIQQDITSALLDFNTGGNTQRMEALR